jgi:hypothetical protein
MVDLFGLHSSTVAVFAVISRMLFTQSTPIGWTAEQQQQQQQNEIV